MAGIGGGRTKKPKRHDEKLAKRDRNIPSFFGPISKLKVLYIPSPPHSILAQITNKQKYKLQKSSITHVNAVQKRTIQENTKAEYSEKSSAGSQKKSKEIFEQMKENAKSKHKIKPITHRKTKNSQIWDCFKAKTNLTRFSTSMA